MQRKPYQDCMCCAYLLPGLRRRGTMVHRAGVGRLRRQRPAMLLRRAGTPGGRGLRRRLLCGGRELRRRELLLRERRVSHVRLRLPHVWRVLLGLSGRMPHWHLPHVRLHLSPGI